MTIYTTVGERINLSACDGGHESGDDLPQLISIDGLAEDTIELYLCHAHRVSLLAMLKRRFPANETVESATVQGDIVPWIRGDAPSTGWAELTPEYIQRACADTGTSVRAWWLTAMRLADMGVLEMGQGEDGHAYTRMWHLDSAPVQP